MAVEPNKNWAIPEAAPDYILRRATPSPYLRRIATQDEDGQECVWHKIPSKFFRHTPVPILDLLMAYLKHCHAQGTNFPYMPSRDLDPLYRALPLVKVVTQGRAKSWWCPLNIPVRLLSPTRVLYWQKAATNWQAKQEGPRLLTLEELRDMVYRLSDLLEGEECVERKYFLDWLKSLNVLGAGEGGA